MFNSWLLRLFIPHLSFFINRADHTQRVLCSKQLLTLGHAKTVTKLTQTSKIVGWRANIVQWTPDPCKIRYLTQYSCKTTYLYRCSLFRVENALERKAKGWNFSVQCIYVPGTENSETVPTNCLWEKTGLLSFWSSTTISMVVGFSSRSPLAESAKALSYRHKNKHNYLLDSWEYFTSDPRRTDPTTCSVELFGVCGVCTQHMLAEKKSAV